MGFFEQLSFGWMNKVVVSARRNGHVDLDPLPLPDQQTTAVASPAFDAAWASVVADAKKTGKRPKLVTALSRAFGRDLMKAGVFKLGWSFCVIMGEFLGRRRRRRCREERGRGGPRFFASCGPSCGREPPPPPPPPPPPARNKRRAAASRRSSSPPLLPLRPAPRPGARARGVCASACALCPHPRPHPPSSPPSSFRSFPLTLLPPSSPKTTNDETRTNKQQKNPQAPSSSRAPSCSSSTTTCPWPRTPTTGGS